MCRTVCQTGSTNREAGRAICRRPSRRHSAGRRRAILGAEAGDAPSRSHSRIRAVAVASHWAGMIPEGSYANRDRMGSRP